MSNKINHDIMNEEVIDREELIEYLTYLLEHDGEVEKFYERQNLVKRVETFVLPDLEAFRDWLEEQTFDTMIRESYFNDYIKELYEDMGEYDPKSWLHKHFNWREIEEEILDSGDYEGIFGNEEGNPFDIFREEFYYHI